MQIAWNDFLEALSKIVLSLDDEWLPEGRTGTKAKEAEREVKGRCMPNWWTMAHSTVSLAAAELSKYVWSADRFLPTSMKEIVDSKMSQVSMCAHQDKDNCCYHVAWMRWVPSSRQSVTMRSIVDFVRVQICSVDMSELPQDRDRCMYQNKVATSSTFWRETSSSRMDKGCLRSRSKPWFVKRSPSRPSLSYGWPLCWNDHVWAQYPILRSVYIHDTDLSLHWWELTMSVQDLCLIISAMLLQSCLE